MQPLGVNELRKMFLEFFESKQHYVLKSFPLVPKNDKSLLLINSGMAPLKPYFTGQEVPPSKRVTTCQKCIRTGDIENVGKTARHGTFFEMLGNFSFGDYFKEDGIKWAWEFLTEVVGIDADRLYPSVYEEDDEAYRIWNEEIGLPKEKIFRMGKEDNFWEHGEGPCGPSSEIYYDKGEAYGCGRPDCTVGCECDRYMEIWNIVFTQFEGDGKGHYGDLAQKNIDTGMGLERLASVTQDVESIFDVDTLKALRDHVCRLAQVTYQKDSQTDVSIRVITDHIRSVTFMISDGIMPSNEGRGYVLRRLLRRACRHGRLLGIQGAFLPELARTVIAGSKDGYPELEEKRAFILKVIENEEEQFGRTIDQGLTILKDLMADMAKTGAKELSGEEAFRLYDTYGFPIDLTKEILLDAGLQVDEAGFKACMEVQKKMAREARNVTNYMGADATVYEKIDVNITSEFTGYDKTEESDEIAALTDDEDVRETLETGEEGTVVTRHTPFYATSGGQECDHGLISTKDGLFVVTDVKKIAGKKIGHMGYVKEGVIALGEKCELKVEKKRRKLGAANHSATHLLQKALRIVLGDHVEQAGSLNSADRLRFDFTHFGAMTREEIERTEKLVNDAIREDLPVSCDLMPIEEARKTGAQALFGEKYGDIVRVVTMGDFSLEFCGGTHVGHTGEIGAFKILQESGVASGVRRIEALTGEGLIRYYEEMTRKVMAASDMLKGTPETFLDKIAHLQDENKSLRGEIESLKNAAALDAASDILSQVKDVCGVPLLSAALEGIEMNTLREMSDDLKDKVGGVIVLASGAEGKVSLIVSATDEAVKKGVHCGKIIKEAAKKVGGGGGGRPNMAQAGGKNAEGIAEALQVAETLLESQLQ